MTIFIDDHLGGAWCHETDVELVDSFACPRSYFDDKDEEFFDDDDNWTHPSIIPLATVGWGQDADDDDRFFNDSFAFWDLGKGTIVSATTELKQRLR